MMSLRLRARLFHGTAVAAALVVTTNDALAATLPTGGSVVAGTITAVAGFAGTDVGGGVGTTINSTASAPTLALEVTGSSAIVNWNSFDIDAGQGVAFSNTTTGTAYSVLNRVTGAGITTINGAITGDATGSIWLINQNGITFGNTASITNVAGFVASALDVSDTDFENFLTTPVKFSGTGNGAITIDANAGADVATITPGGALLLVAPKLDLQGGALTAGGDAAFVVAADATVRLTADSIVNIKIDKGTPLATPSAIGATVGGRRVLVAAASQADLVGALLNIGGDLTATTAVATDKGIVLAAGRDVTLAGSDTISFTPADAGATPPVDGARFTAGIGVTGTLNAGAGGLEARSGGGLALAGITTGGTATVESTDGSLTLGGGMTLGGGLVARGQTAIVLGNGSSTTAISVHDAVSIVSTGGSITAAGTVGVTSNAAGTSADNGLTLEAFGAIGDLASPDRIALTGGTVASRAAVTVTAGGASDISLGAVTGSKLASTVAGTDLVAPGAVQLGAIDVAAPLTVSASAGDVTMTSIASGGAVQVGSSGSATVRSTVTANGSYLVTGAAVSLGTAATPVSQSAAGEVRIKATGAGGITTLGTLTLVSNSDGPGNEALTLDSAGAITGGPTLNGGIAGNLSAVRIHLADASKAITLGTVTGASLASVNADPYDVSDGTLTTTGDISLGAVTTTDALAVNTSNGGIIAGLLTSTGGGVTAEASGGTGTLSVAGASGGSISLSAINAASVTGAVTATGDYTVRGGSVVLGATGTTPSQSATGNVLVRATGTGGIRTDGTLTLIADSAGTGDKKLVLDSAGPIVAGTLPGDTPATLRAGAGATATTGNRSDILIAMGDATQALTLGDIDGETLVAATGAPPMATVSDYTPGAALAFGNTIGLGKIDLVSGVSVTGATVSVGDTTSLTGGVTLTANTGVLTVGSLRAEGAGTTGTVDLTGKTGIALRSGGPFTVVARNDLNAQSDGAIALGSVRVGGVVAVGATAPGGRAASFSAGSLQSGLGTSVLSSGTISLTGLTETTGRPLTADLSGYAAGAPAIAALTLDSSGGAVTLPTGANATGALTINGNAMTLGTTGVTSSLAGTSIALTLVGSGAGDRIDTRGNFALTTPGALTALRSDTTTGASFTQNDSFAATGASVSIGAVDYVAQSTLLGSGDVSVTATGLLPTNGVAAGRLQGRGAIIATAAAGPVSIGGADNSAATSAQNVLVSSDIGVTVGGSVTATGNYTVVGSTVALGTAGTVSQSAAGDVRIRATSGGIAASGDLTIASNSDGAGGGSLILDVASGVDLANAITGAPSLIGGTSTERTDVGIRLGGLVPRAVTLGSVTGNRFGLVDYNTLLLPSSGYAAVTGSFTNAGAITLGALTTVQSIDLKASLGNLTAGVLTSTGGGVAAESTLGTLSVGGADSATGSDVKLTSAADLTATSTVSSGRDLTITSTLGNATLAGASGARDVSVNATFTAAVGGNATVTRDYSVKGREVVLGNGSAVSQSAGGTVTIEATGAGVLGGTITGQAGLTLMSDSGGLGSRALTLKTAGIVGGDIAFSGTTLRGGPAGTSAVLIDSRTIGSSVVLGDVTASVLQGQVGGLGLFNGLVRTGALTVGSLTLGQGVTLTSSGSTLTVGAVSAPTIALSSAGFLTATSLEATNGALTIAGTGGVQVTGAATAAGALGDVTVTRADALSFGSLSASRDLGISTATTVDVAGTTNAGRALSIASSGNQTFTGAITANGTGGLATLSSSGGTLSLGTLSTIGVASLTGAAVGATSVAGASVGISATVGNATVDAITTTAGNATVAASGNPTSTATVSGAVTVVGDYGVTGPIVILGAAAATPTQQATGAVTITSTGGTLTGLSGLTLLANSDGSGLAALTLATTGSSGGDIGFAGTTLRGGPALQSVVNIRSRTGASAVTLGTISALGLNGAVGADPFVTGLTRTGALAVGDVTLTQALLLDAGTTITGGALTAASVTLDAGGDITVGQLTANAGGVSAISGGTLSVPGASSSTGFDVTLQSATSLSVGGTVVSGRDINITSTGGNATLTDATAPRSISVTAASGATFTAALGDGTAITGDITLSGGNVAVTTKAVAGDDVVVRATAGTVTAAALSATGAGSDSESGNDGTPTLGLAGLGGSNIVVQASGDITLSGLARGARDVTAISTGGAVLLTDGAAARNLTLGANGYAGVTLARAGGALLVSAGSLGGTGGLGVGTSTLEAGLSINATASAGGLNLTTVRTTGLALLADLSGFGATPTATPGLDVVLSASGDALLGTGRSTRDLMLTSTGGTTTLSDGGTFVDGGSAPAIGIARDVSVTATSGTATITSVTAGGSVTATGTAASTIGRAFAGGTILASGGVASVGTGVAGGGITASGTTAQITGATAAGSILADATGGFAQIASGTSTGGGAIDARTTAAALASIDAATTSGDVRATSVGAAQVTNVSAGRSVIVKGATATVVTSATAGDDIILATTSGAANAAALTVTGAGPDVAATDGYGNPIADPLGGPSLTGTGGSNIIVRAAGTATVTGAVAVTQANPAASADYRVGGASVVLGTGGAAIAQGAAGAVTLTATSGGVTLAGTGGTLESNVGGARSAAAGSLSINAGTGVSGANVAVIANRASSGAQADAPGVTIAAAAGGGGSINLASARGGPVTITAPGTITVPLVTASGGVSIRGVATSGFDTATIDPLTISIDGQGITGFAPVAVTVAGGAGAEVASIGVANGGTVGAFTLAANTGNATLRGAPTLAASIGSIVVESQTGAARIVNPSEINGFAAGSIAIRGRQAGSTATGSGLLHATGNVSVTGPTATLGNALSDAGTILVAATGAASLATGALENATATTGSISVSSSGDAATLGQGTAGGTIAVRGATITVDRGATAGDDIVLLGDTAVTTTGATLATTGGPDLQAGNDGATLALSAIGTIVGGSLFAPAGPATILTDIAGAAVGTVAGTALRQLAGSNIAITSGGTAALGLLTAARDLRIETGGSTVPATASVTLGTTSVGRDLLVADALLRSGGIVATGPIQAGDDVVLTSANGAIDASAATLRTTGAGGLTSAMRVDGTILANPLGGAGITDLGGNNIALAASGPITLGAIAGTGAPSSLRAFAGGAVTTTTALTASGSIVLAGSTVTVAPTHSLTAGNDIVAAARSGAASIGAILTTTGTAASDSALTGLSGEAVTLADATMLGRVEGSSIVVAGGGITTLPAAIDSAGRLTIIGRGGVGLGTGSAATLQQAARDVLVEASAGTSAAAASVTLADGMTLASNSDGSGTGDNLTVRIGNGSLNAATATLRTGRSAAATLAGQGVVGVESTVADGVKSIAIDALDSASSTLRALDDVIVNSATIDAGLVLASKAGAASLTSVTIGSAVPLMTAAETNAIDIGVLGATGATIGAIGGTVLARDVTVATTNGTASITGAAAARDDIIVVSTNGMATANLLTTGGVAVDSETSALDPARDADGIALLDPYQLTGTTITGLTGRNIIVAGGTGATLTSVTVPALQPFNGVRVLAASGPATLTTLNSNGGSVLDVIVGTRDGTAAANAVNTAGNLSVIGTTAILTQAQATGTIRVDAGAGGATIGDAQAGLDLLVGSAGAADIINASAVTGDAGVIATGLVTAGRLTAGNDLRVSAGSAVLGAGSTGLVAARRNLAVTSAGALSIGTARAGAGLSAQGGSVVATTVEAGDRLVIAATGGDATVTDARSIGQPLLADFSGFGSGSAAGSTRDIEITASSVATLTTGTAVHGISVTGATAVVNSATANTGGSDGDLSVTAGAGDATLGTGSGRDVRVATTGGGSATATTAAATRDLFVDASGGLATLTTGTAERDAVVVGPSVVIGDVGAGDDIVVAANGGTLMATSLTATGADSGDMLDSITRADGSALPDPVATTAIAGLASGGTILALATGDVTIGSATATAAPGAVAPGLVRLAALGGLSVTSATASAGDIVLGGITITAATVNAGRDIGIAANGGDASIGTITAARDLTLRAANDAIVTDAATMGRDVSVTAARDIRIAASAAPAVVGLAAGGNATLVAGRDLAVLRQVTTGSAFAANAGGALSIASFGSGGPATLVAPGTITIAGDSSATGALAATSSGGAIGATALAGGGIALTAANAVEVSGAATSTAGLTADGGTVGFGSVSAVQGVTLRSRGALSSGATTAGTTLVASSDAGVLTLGATTSGGNATVTSTAGPAALASLTAGGTASLRAAQALEVTGAARTASTFTATSDSASLKLGSLDAGAPATLRARTGLTVTGLARSGAALDALSSAGAVMLGSASSGTTTTVRGATGVVIGGTTAGGAVAVTADTGDLVAGDVNSGGDVTLTGAAGAATVTSVSKASKLTIAAATDATVSGAVATSGDTSVTATNGSATLASSVNTANYTVTAANGTITLGNSGGVQRSSGTATLESQRLVLGGTATLAAATRVQLNVTGNATSVALGGATADAAKYALAKADLRKFQTPTMEINAGSRGVDIGDTDLDGVAAVSGGFAGITGALGIRTTGDIRVTDTVKFATPTGTTTPRVLTLGGAAGGANLDKTTATAGSIRVLARPTLDNAATGTGGQILAAGSTVQLRATYVALGETPSPDAGRPFIDDLLPASGTPLDTPVVRSQFLNNAGSTFYTATPAFTKQSPGPQTLVKSGALVLAAGKWALIQNTGVSAQPGGGIDVSSIQLNRLGGTAAPDPVIGVFGGVSGKTGIVAAISVSSEQLDGISPNNVRINGCVALSTGGCIQSNVAIPLINLADPGRSLLISSAPDLALSIELITGATNEALWREDDDDPSQNRPQRESRP